MYHIYKHTCLLIHTHHTHTTHTRVHVPTHTHTRTHPHPQLQLVQCVRGGLQQGEAHEEGGGVVVIVIVIVGGGGGGRGSSMVVVVVGGGGGGERVGEESRERFVEAFLCIEKSRVGGDGVIVMLVQMFISGR